MHQKFGIVALYSWVKAACRALVYFFYYKQYFEKKLSFFFKMDPLVALLFGSAEVGKRNAMHQKFGSRSALYSWVKAPCLRLVYFFYYKQ